MLADGAQDCTHRVDNFLWVSQLGPEVAVTGEDQGRCETRAVMSSRKACQCWVHLIYNGRQTQDERRGKCMPLLVIPSDYVQSDHRLAEARSIHAWRLGSCNVLTMTAGIP